MWHFFRTSLLISVVSLLFSFERGHIVSIEEIDYESHAQIQVNIDNELSKSGIKPEDMISFAQDIDSNFPNLNLKGLMFMPNINLNKTNQLKTFKNIQFLMQSLINLLPNCDQLSLGTSDDYIEAIKAGSSMIRIGEDLLGPRS